MIPGVSPAQTGPRVDFAAQAMQAVWVGVENSILSAYLRSIAADVSQRLALVERAQHVTRDTEADTSRGRHRVQNHAAIGVHLLHVAVTVVPMAGVLSAPAEAGHVAHASPWVI